MLRIAVLLLFVCFMLLGPRFFFAMVKGVSRPIFGKFIKYDYEFLKIKKGGGGELLPKNRLKK